MTDDNSLPLEMGEIAALPPDDPLRVDLERRLPTDETSASQEWCDLLEENEFFRNHLRTVDVPCDLEDRLLSVGHAASRRAATRGRRWAMAAAVVVVLLLSTELVRRSTADSRMRTVALLAINNHLNHLEDHGVLAGANDTRKLEETLSAEVGFPVSVPRLDDGLQLAGGRKCRLGTHPVAFTLWHDSAGNYSLFQFQPDRFGLSSTIEPGLVRTTQPAGAEHSCGAWIWTEGPYGYVLTGDPGNDLQRLSPGSHSAD